MKAKRLSGSSIEVFHVATLTLSDLRAICAFGPKRNLSVKIEDSFHEYESLEDLRDNAPRPIKKLDITFREDAQYQALQVLFDKGVTRVYANDPDEMTGIRQDISAYLKSRSSWTVKFFSTGTWASIFVGSAFLLPIAKGTYLNVLLSTLAVELLVLLCSAVLSRKRSHLILTSEDASSGLWPKYEKVVIGIGGAVFGAFAKAAADHLLK